ncbi:GAF and ANTAR domain-containing protein [Promicromonospora iranensis]|jgi:transcriptional regulator with GAF, ATPase, and Fis domain|uniref:GAF and ANTAR domain-containing protein n=1 Tax=Promicromonospora iranensis TaxID=1105144 RepID=UPI0023A996A4|nr:GAF and ANTAR domain-containing protein [Promicromonospora iranensis]
MTPRTPADTLADAASALVREHDTSDLLVRLVRDAATLAGGAAAGLLVRASDAAHLELLAATDHVATHLEVYQAQQHEGPCVDVCTTGRPVMAAEASEILSRWPVTGRAILDAGFRRVQAYPLVWQGRMLGGLNIFGREEGTTDSESARMAHAYADMLTLVIAQPERAADGEIDDRLARVLRGRVTIEQAKGVLAQRLGVDMTRAYEVLLDKRDQDGTTLTKVAQQVITEAHQR